MNVLFISSGGKRKTISPIINNQAASLLKEGLNIETFVIPGEGLFSYIKAWFVLLIKVRSNSYNIMHAHYRYCGILSIFLFKKPIICSLMGLHGLKGFNSKIYTFLSYYFWDSTIVKSQEMYKLLKGRNTYIIPNGVDLNKFNQKDKLKAKESVGFPEKFIFLFFADPKRKEKNYSLAEEAIKMLGIQDVHLKVCYEISNDLVPIYLNAADCLLFTSTSEGSPNIIKEAMACNLPIVSTIVGDVNELLSGVKGCFLSDYNINNLLSALNDAYIYCKDNRYSEGRKRLIKLGLDSESVAKKVINIYNNAIIKK